jgi:hypothetical protein
MGNFFFYSNFQYKSFLKKCIFLKKYFIFIMNLSIDTSFNVSSFGFNSTLVNGPLMFPIIWNTFVIPIICAFGMVTNALCVYIFMRLKLKQDLYKYMLASSCICFLYLFMCFFSFTIRCSPLCSFNSTYAARLYHLYIFLYVTSILGISKGFIELFICLERFLAMKNLMRKISYKLVLLVILILSTFIYTTVLLDFQIRADSSTNNSTPVVFVVNKSDFGQTNEMKALVITTSCIRGPVILFALFMLDILSIIQFKRILKRKKWLLSIDKANNTKESNEKKNLEKAEINLNKTVITSSILFIVCNFPNVATFIMNTLNFNKTSFFTYFSLFSNTVLFIYHGLNFFVYYKFNKKFRNFFRKKQAQPKLISIETVTIETYGSQ